MLGNYLIGLREGLEASLIVSILVAYLVKTDRRYALKYIWAGVGIAIVISIAAGALLEFTARDMTFEQRELLGGALSIVAVGFVTWMVFWMRGAARGLAADLRGRLDSAFELGPLALATVALLAVGREGLETSLFIWATTNTATAGSVPLLGALLGLATAVALGWLIYRGAIKINLGTFFTITGAALIVVAAGVLAYGFHDLQEAGVMSGLNSLAFDISGAIAPDGVAGTLLKGTVNFQPDPTWLQVAAWLLYLVPTVAIYFAGPRAPRHSPAKKEKVTA